MYTLFFYKNLVYKNIKASNGPNIKNILSSYQVFKYWVKNFAEDNKYLKNISVLLR